MEITSLCTALIWTALSIGLASSAMAQERKIERGEWSERLRIDEEHGTMPLRPMLVGMSGGSITVFDHGDYSLQRFNANGQREWKVGRKGGALGEYQNVTDMVVTSTGEVILLDGEASRLTVVGANDRVSRAISLTEQLFKMTARSADRIYAIPLLDNLLVDLSSNGRVLRSASLPDELRPLSPLVRESTVYLTEGGYLIIVHAWSTRVWVLGATDLRIVQRGDLLDRVAFPTVVSQRVDKYIVNRVDPKRRRVIQSAAVTGDTLVILDARGVRGQPVLDCYHLPSLRYLISRAAPAGVVGMVTNGGTLTALVDEPVPAVVQWQWSSSNARRD